jgi:hypothetical protein
MALVDRYNWRLRSLTRLGANRTGTLKPLTIDMIKPFFENFSRPREVTLANELRGSVRPEMHPHSPLELVTPWSLSPGKGCAKVAVVASIRSRPTVMTVSCRRQNLYARPGGASG